MARYLSAEWFDETSATLAASHSSPAGPPATEGGAIAGPEEIVLQQVVTGGPDGDVSYRLEISRGRSRLLPGPGAADVTITEDYGTAAALHRGQLTLQEAFQAGRVKVAGNVAILLARQAALAEVGPFGAVKETTY